MKCDNRIMYGIIYISHKNSFLIKFNCKKGCLLYAWNMIESDFPLFSGYAIFLKMK